MIFSAEQRGTFSLMGEQMTFHLEDNFAVFWARQLGEQLAFKWHPVFLSFTLITTAFSSQLKQEQLYIFQ